jgi:hypothetical protein
MPPWEPHFNSLQIGFSEVKAELRKLRDLISHHRKEDMATKQEVQADIAEIKQIVADTRGAANSAIALLKEVLGKVDTAAATATDLDALRTDLKLIKDETLAEEADLKAAVAQNPGPPAPPQP